MVFGFLKRMFASSDAPSTPAAAEADPFDYKGFTVQPAPRKEASGWRVAGVITREIEGAGTRRHEFIRADVFAGLDEALEITSNKARRLVDEQGERLFGD